MNYDKMIERPRSEASSLKYSKGRGRGISPRTMIDRIGQHTEELNGLNQD